jgi:predicted phage terminase large subunit-like protein
VPLRSPLYHVPKQAAEDLLREVHVQVEAKARKTRREFNPSLGKTAEEAERKLQKMREDINAYGEYVYGLPAARHHRFWNKTVDDIINRRVPQNKLLILAPPNSAKSTWNSVIRTTHYLGNHPDKQIVFLTSSDDMAKAFGSSVRMTLAESERHREVFPEDGARPNRRRGWSGEGLYLRGLPLGMKDPNYKAVGWGMTIMGARAHGIIMDDVLDQKDAESEAVQRHAISYYDKTVVPRLDTHEGWLIAVMTRFAEGDLGGHFLKLAKRSGDWLVIKTPLEAEENDPMGRMPGEILWPEQYPKDWVRQLKLRLTIADYMLVYGCDPTAAGGDIFTDERYFKDLPDRFWFDIYPKCFTAQAIDLGFSRNQKRAFTVIMTFAVDEHFNMYILHVERRRMIIADSEERIYELARALKPMLVAIETENFHDKLIRGMVLRIMQRLMINIQLEKPDANKEQRARLPAARVEHGFVYMDMQAPWARTFITECMAFPRGTYKDQVDTFSLAALVVQNLDESAMKTRSSRRPIQTEVVLAG